MTEQLKIQLSAVMMSATHIYLERIKTADMLPRDLTREIPGSAGPFRRTYADMYASEAADTAWKLAQAVERSGQVLNKRD